MTIGLTPEQQQLAEAVQARGLPAASVTVASIMTPNPDGILASATVRPRLARALPAP